MLKHHSRDDFFHVQGLFDTAILKSALDQYEDVEAELQSLAKTSREAKMQRIGATSDALRMREEWYVPWRHISKEAIAWFDPFFLLLYPVQIRHVKDEYHLVPWHQDIAYIRQMARPHRQVVTCFVPLEMKPCQHSTLAFIPGPHAELIHGEFADHSAKITNALNGEPMSHALNFGDALVFGDHAVHRTHCPDGARLGRRSFEFRLVQDSDALDGKDYFDIRTGEFVNWPG